MFPEEFNERCSRSLQHDILVQIHELPQGPNLSPACTESGPNFGMLIFIWPYATFCSHIPSTPILKLQPCRSSICKRSFIPSAVPALTRGPLSQWCLVPSFSAGADILVADNDLCQGGRVLPLFVSSTLWLSEQRVYAWVSTSPGEDCLADPSGTRDSRAQYLLILLGGRPPISSSKSVFPKQSQYCPKGVSQSIVGPVKWVKCNVYCA